MRTIWKFELEDGKVKMPACAVIRHVGCQRTTVCIWAEVVSDAPLETRTFEVFGTGHEIPVSKGQRYRYLGTAQDFAGFVWHVYETYLTETELVG